MKLDKIIYVFAILLTGSVISISSCKKDDDSPLHLNTATITISSPPTGALYHANDTVPISCSLTASETIHGCDLFIRKKSDYSLVFTCDIHTHHTSFTVDTFWINTFFGDTTELELEIVATVDHNGNTQSGKINFKCIP